MKNDFGGLLAGFLIAPAVPVALMFAAQVFTIGYRDAAEGALILLVIGYASAVVLGIPAYFFLRSKGMVDLKNYLVLGAIIGIAYYALIFIPTYLKTDPEYVWELIRGTVGLGVIGMAGGLIASFVFWFIAVRPHSRPMAG